MTRGWSDNDVALLLRWVNVVAPLYADGVSDDAVIAALAWQMRQDCAGCDNAGLIHLIEGWAPMIHQAAAELRQEWR